MTGGYKVDTASGNFTNKDALTAIDVPALMQWVVNSSPGDTAARRIRQIHNPIFRVTGGAMKLGAGGVTMLIFGAISSALMSVRPTARTPNRYTDFASPMTAST
jgi:hypothetical protein